MFSDVDIVLYGHSHIAVADFQNDVFVFNPGSPTSNVDAYGSYGILTLGETIQHQIIELK